MVTKDKWCKIVKVGKEQVLFYLEADPKDPTIFSVMHQLVLADDGWTMDLSVRNIPIDDSYKVFDSVNRKVAANAIRQAKELYEQSLPDFGLPADEYNDV